MTLDRALTDDTFKKLRSCRTKYDQVSLFRRNNKLAFRQFLFKTNHIQTTSVSSCNRLVVHQAISNTFAAINGHYRKLRHTRKEKRLIICAKALIFLQ